MGLLLHHCHEMGILRKGYFGERSEPLSGHVNGSSRYIYTYVNSKQDS